jgi:hypothetical protein
LEKVELGLYDAASGIFGDKDSPVNGTSAPVFRLMSDS